MTYEEQLKIEKLSKETFKRITENIKQDDFVAFYKTHTKQETKNFYNINNDRTLKKILDFFNYDWSYQKSRKGKPTGRDHDSYINSGKKSAQTQKQNWENKSEKEKIEWSNMQKAAHNTHEFKSKIKQINIEYYASLTDVQKAELKQKKRESNKTTWDKNKKEILAKAPLTKSINNSWNTSSPEDRFYQHLCIIFGESDVLRQYSDTSRYNHNCNFYIKSKDLFIELNISWTHGGHKFNATDIEDINKLAVWQEKAKDSDFYKKAIDVWTRLDIEKFNDAEKNNLNYLVFYTEEAALNYEF